MNDQLTEAIIAAAIEVHSVLGPGLLEAIYEDALAVELGLRGIAYDRQVEKEFHYKGVPIRGQRLDFVVAGEVVVEIKSVSQLPGLPWPRCCPTSRRPAFAAASCSTSA